jgi:hypothetical protein
MTIREFHLQTVLATLENANCLGRLLFFPEVSAYGREPEEVRAELARLADKVLRDLPLVDLHRRCAAGELEVREVTVEVRPPDVTFWTTPLPLRFHVVCWNHGRDAGLGHRNRGRAA